jgi:DNA-binding response OmpR family regulator
MWKILCASDSAGIKKELDALDPSFYDVQIARSFNEACACFIVEAFNIYLLDADMPGENPIQMVKTVRLVDRNAALICISGSDSDRLSAIEAGADIFLQSPVGIGLVRTTIDNLLDKTSAVR